MTFSSSGGPVSTVASTFDAMDERRVHARRTPDAPLVAIHMDDGTILGEITDLSVGGFKLKVRSDFTLQRRGLYPIRIDLQQDGVVRWPVFVTVQNVWQHRIDPASPDLTAGFVFIEPSPKARRHLESYLRA